MNWSYQIIVLLLAATSQAQDPPSPTRNADEAVEVYGRSIGTDVDPDRVRHTTNQKQLAERQVRSTPEALTYSPGVYVQQTAHGQGSPYIRGRTGLRTLLLFDGLRLNHALFRKGPNQYLFTVDARTLSGIDVIRGSSSVEFGNDAIAGAILLRPLEPKLDPGRSGVSVRPSIMTRLGTADGERGGRLQLNAQFGSRFAVVGGVGARTVGQLEAGGQAFPNGRADGQACESSLSVPCFTENGRTQRGTGYDELTTDVRGVYDTGDIRLTVAGYLYRQYDAPRTDQCPAPEAAIGECLVFEEQFRSHTYAKLESHVGAASINHVQASLSAQRQHQKHRLTRPDRNPNDTIDTTTINGGRDAVNGYSGYVRAQTKTFNLSEQLNLNLRYGLDGSYEVVDSKKWIEFAQPVTLRVLSRGQYVADSTMIQSGLYASPAVTWGSVRVRAGVRASIIRTASPGDVESASRSFEQTHLPVVSNVGIKWGEDVALIGNLEQGFRAPNLDDLTARQSTGQGYQLENPALKPERALTAEVGLLISKKYISGEALVFHQTLTDAIERRLLQPDECQLSPEFVDQACRANRAPLQLTNLSRDATIYGAEARLRLRPLQNVEITSTISYALGEGPDPVDGKTGVVPLSRIPPLNGTGEVTWRSAPAKAYVSGVIRWAAQQERLSTGDVADARIPAGGTPGYRVYDIRMGIRLPSSFRLFATVENISDARYRTHGSGVLGAGRSVLLGVDWLGS